MNHGKKYPKLSHTSFRGIINYESLKSLFLGNSLALNKTAFCYWYFFCSGISTTVENRFQYPKMHILCSV